LIAYNLIRIPKLVAAYSTADQRDQSSIHRQNLTII